MQYASDEELIGELRRRLEDNVRALHDLRTLSAQLETTNRRLQESEALKGHFLSNIRNEINNPLAAILGLASRVAAGCAPDQSRTIGELICAEALTLDFQLENIFVAAELEAGEAMPTLARTDAASLVAEVIGEMTHRMTQKQISLHRSGSESIPFVTDPRMLELMVRNLVANAVQFTPEGGEVSIDVTSSGQELRIAVRDQGPGIEEGRQEEIFERFRQLEMGSTKSHPGQGLGLSVSRALAELLQGNLEVVSGVEPGSTFILRLPEAASSVAAVALEGNFFLFDHAERF